MPTAGELGRLRQRRRSRPVLGATLRHQPHVPQRWPQLHRCSEDLALPIRGEPSVRAGSTWIRTATWTSFRPTSRRTRTPSIATTARASRTSRRNWLYRNLGGGKFRDVAAEAGV